METEQSSTGWIGRILDRLEQISFLKGRLSQAVFLGLYFLVALSCYLVVLKIRGHRPTFITRIPWDDAFPFTVWWTWVYLIPYVLGPVLAISLRRQSFEWYIRRATIVMAITLLIFCLVPTQTVRPNVDHVPEGITKALYVQMVTIDDPPANAAPSLHVSLSCLLAWALAYDRPRWWPAALLLAVVVWLSTLYTHQHHLIDVVTGAALASLAAIGRPKTHTERALTGQPASS